MKRAEATKRLLRYISRHVEVGCEMAWEVSVNGIAVFESSRKGYRVVRLGCLGRQAEPILLSLPLAFNAQRSEGEVGVVDPTQEQ
eukprot:gene7403-5213_t